MVRRSFNSNHHVVQFFPRFVGGRMVMPYTQRANGALTLAAIKLTCLVTPPTDPKALPSQCHQIYHTTTIPIATPIQPPSFHTPTLTL